MKKILNNSLSLKENMIWNSIGNMWYLFCQWLTTIFVVLISGYRAAGILALAMSVTNTMSNISRYGIRGYHVSDSNNMFSTRQYIQSRYYTCIFSFLICVIYVIGSEGTLEEIACLLMFMIFKIIEAIIDAYHGIYQKYNRMDIIGKSAIYRGTALLMSFTLTLMITDNLFCSITTMTLSSIGLMLLYDIRQLRYFPNQKNQKENYKTYHLIMKCTSLGLYGVIISFIPTYPRIVLENTLGTEILGIYATIATPIVIIQVAAMLILNPIIEPLARYYNRKEYKQFFILIAKCFGAIATMGILSIIVAMLFGETLLVLVFGESISEYAYLLTHIIVCALLISVIYFLATIFTVIRKLNIILIANAIGGVVCMFGSHYFINVYEMQGVNMTIIFSFGVSILLQLCYFLTVARKEKVGHE